MNYRGLNIPKVSFGNIDSDALFAEKEQALFDFYCVNEGRYYEVLDIGANIGVHSILMARHFQKVWAFEPDPITSGHAYANICANVEEDWKVELRQAAVSDRAGKATFVRVKGNTTGSHLEGCKSPYGPTERFEVETVDCRPLFDWADFAKIDCEGHEAVLIDTLTVDQLAHLDLMVEVGSPANAVRIYKHLEPMGGVKMWAQRLDWGRVRCMGDMPTHHSEGALFIGLEAPFGSR